MKSDQLNADSDTHSVADAMLDVFRAYGVEYLFSSPGSEWTPLWDALAKAKAQGLGPTFINTRHEDLAVGLAMGYYRQTRKLPVVVLHTGIGTLHAAMTLRGALHTHIPMVVLAGEVAGFGEMDGLDPGAQWARGLGDVGGCATQARPHVKRASAATCREVLSGMLQDACRIALTPPLGPVFLSVPMEFMVGPHPRREHVCAPPPRPLQADPSELEAIARDLVEAERPVVVAERAGRQPENVALLVELAEKLGLPVVEVAGASYLNFPREHPLHQGFKADALLAQADFVLLLASRTPWYPSSRRPTTGRVVLVDEDPAHDLMPYWAMPVDRIVGGEMTAALRQLNALVEKSMASSGRAAGFYAERRAFWSGRSAQRRAELRARADAAAQSAVLDPVRAAAAIGKALPPDAILLDEVTTHRDFIWQYVPRNVAGTFHGWAGGGLGGGLGVALGLKLAAPERMVVAILGDGAFNYSPVLASFGFAQQFGMPILVIVLNNAGYAAMKRAHRSHYPDGWSVRTGAFFGTEIEPRPDYAGLAPLFGGYGERVDQAEALQGALARAIARVRDGQLALLDVVVSR